MPWLCIHSEAERTFFMSEMESTVNPTATESAMDDALQAREEQPNVSDGTPFSDFVAGEENQETEQTQNTASEPGWIKQRVNKEVTKAVQATEQRLRAEYEAKLAPLRESMMERQAEELVKQGEFRNIARAKEYLRLGGRVTLEEPSNGREGQPARQDPEASARIKVLAKQADKLAKRGTDVMGVLNSNPQIRDRVMSGEWDMYDVAEAMNAPQRKAPPVVRSANNGNAPAMDIRSMSDAQFKKLQENLRSGKSYDLRG